MATKVTVTSPEELVDKVDADRLTSLAKRGDGNTMVLESIKTHGSVIDGAEIVGSETATEAAKASAKAQAEVSEGVEALKSSGFSADVIDPLTVGVIDGYGAAMQNTPINNVMASIGSGLTAIAKHSDPFGFGEMLDELDGIGLDGSFVDSLVPDVISDMLENFDLDKIAPNLSDMFQDTYMDKLLDNIGRVNNEWWWLDRDYKIYNYDRLANMSEWSLRAVFRSDVPELVEALGYVLKQHKQDSQ